MYRRHVNFVASRALYRRTARRTNVVNLGIGLVPRGGFRLWRNMK